MKRPVARFKVDIEAAAGVGADAEIGIFSGGEGGVEDSFLQQGLFARNSAAPEELPPAVEAGFVRKRVKPVEGPAGYGPPRKRRVRGKRQHSQDPPAGVGGVEVQADFQQFRQRLQVVVVERNQRRARQGCGVVAGGRHALVRAAFKLQWKPPGKGLRQWPQAFRGPVVHHHHFKTPWADGLAREAFQAAAQLHRAGEGGNRHRDFRRARARHSAARPGAAPPAANRAHKAILSR